MTQSFTTREVPAISRRRFLAGAGSLAALTLTGCGSSGSAAHSKPAKAAAAKVDGDLNLFTWEGYVAPAVVKAFEHEHGVTVNQTFFSDENEMLDKLAAGTPFDMTFCASNYLTRAVEGGLLQPVNRDAMHNRDQILPAFESTGYEPDDAAQNRKNAEYIGMPYALGGIGITWLVNRIDNKRALSGSFDDLWTYAAGPANNHTFLFDESQFTLAMALAKVGKDINSSSQSDLDLAVKALLQIKPHLAGFGPTTITQEVLNGTGWIEMAYTGDTFVALEQSKNPGNIKWERCRESAIYNNDNAVIPKAAHHPGTATVFMDYLMEPANTRQIVNAIGYIIPTKEGVAAYNTLVAKYPFLKAETGLISDFSQWVGTLTGAKLQAWQQAWTQVVA